MNIGHAAAQRPAGGIAPGPLTASCRSTRCCIGVARSADERRHRVRLLRGLAAGCRLAVALASLAGLEGHLLCSLIASGPVPGLYWLNRSGRTTAARGLPQRSIRVTTLAGRACAVSISYGGTSQATAACALRIAPSRRGALEEVSLVRYPQAWLLGMGS